MFSDPMDIPTLNGTRGSARLPTQRSSEEDNLLGMLAVMMGYIDRKNPAFMDAISTDRERNILNRFLDRKAIKPHHAKAIQSALKEQDINDIERFGKLFCQIHGSDKEQIINEAYQTQKQRKEHHFIGQILLELGLANVNQVLDVLKEQELNFSENNQGLLAKISYYENEYRPGPVREFYNDHKDVSIFMIIFLTLFLASFAYLLF